MTNKPYTPSSAEITRLLLAWNAGDDGALDMLVPVVYSELKRIARRYIAGERPGHTLQASALVNEAYLNLIDARHVRWQNRAHFFAISARLMREILVGFARRKQYQKRGGGAEKVTLVEGLVVSRDRPNDFVALDDALNTLAVAHPRISKVVELRFFGGLTQQESAEALGVSTDTILRDWRFAKVWLHRELRKAKSQ
jgi:RNA polymerase sigma factor (TIGR02999 family)